MSSGSNQGVVKEIEFKSLGDARGDLIALEGDSDVPFAVKRVFYIYGTKPEVERGFHAHKKLEQLAIVVSGSCVFDVETKDGKQSFLLDSPQKGLYFSGLAWHVMKSFSEDCVLLVLASDVYDESDYVRDYEEFSRLISDLNE